MNKQDLRVIKTRNSIKKAFCEMLKEYPVEKISVTALSKRALINKGTFYLHYQDIYELYNEVRKDFMDEMVDSMNFCSLFLTRPEEFIRLLIQTVSDNTEKIEFLWPKHDMILFQPNLGDCVIQKIYENCSITKSVENDMILNVIIGSIFRISPTYENNPEMTARTLIRVIRAFFPLHGNDD